MVEPLPGLEFERLHHPCEGAAGVGENDFIFLEGLRELLHEPVGVDPLLPGVGGQARRVPGLPVCDPPQPGGAVRSRLVAQPADQRAQEGLRLGVHRQVQVDAELLELSDLGWVYVDHDDLRIPREGGRGRSRGLGVEPRADRQNQVGILDREIGVANAVRPEAADRERILRGHEIQRRPRHGDGQVGPAGERHGLALRAGEVDAPAVDNHRPLGLFDRGDALGNGGRGDLRRPRPLVRGIFDQLRGIDIHPLQVIGNVDQDRARAPGARDRDRLLQLIAYAVRVGDQHGILGDRLADGHHVGFLESDLAHARVALRPEGGDLPGQIKDRHRVVV